MRRISAETLLRLVLVAVHPRDIVHFGSQLEAARARRGRRLFLRWGRLVVHTLIVPTLAAGCGKRTPELTPGFVVARPVAPLFEPAAAPELLEGPSRDRWQKPDQLVAALSLRRGDSVADIGAGSGYLTSRLSRAVGPTGMVLAEEIQEAFLPELERRAKSLGNARAVLGDASDPRLPRRDIDCFVLLTVYHEVDHPVDFLKALKGYAAPGARLAIIDFDPNRKGNPPPPERHCVEEAAVLKEARAAGWTFARRREIVPSQFFLIFENAR